MTRKLIGLLFICAVCAAPAHGETIGVVMMHGKTGTPARLEELAARVTEAGFLVARPEMCWSRARIYDAPYLDCLVDADKAAAALKARGADAIVILGMSLGANGALGFGARRPALKGVIALAPASAPELLRERPPIARSLAEAHALIAAGKGDEKRSFNDLNNGHEFSVTTTAKIYVTFFGRESPAVMPANAAKLTAPLLMVSGTDDPTQRTAGAIFSRAPANPRNSHLTVKSDHLGTPAAATAAVVGWLKALPP